MVNVLVSLGDTLEVDQPVVELETDKATVEVPAPAAGKVTDIAVKAGGIRNYNRHLVFLAATWRFFVDGESMVVRFQLEKK